MSRTIKTAAVLLCLSAGVVVCYLPLSGAPKPEAGVQYRSPEAIVVDKAGKTLYIAEVTAKRIAIFDIAARKVTKHIDLPAEPTGLTLSPDGSKLFVTCGMAPGKVVICDPAAGSVQKVFPAGHSPRSPVLDRSTGTLYVCDRFRNAILVFDPSGKQTASIPVLRDPYAAALTLDGKKLFVANHLPAGPGDVDYVACAISVVDTAAKKVVVNIKLPNGATGILGLAMSTNGKYVTFTHILARFHLPTTQLERGWMSTNAMSIVDTENDKLINTVLLDNVDSGASNPRGITWSADDKFICVVQAGTHDISVIDVDALMKKLDKAVAEKKAEGVVNDLSFLVDLRRRLRLMGNGPRGVVLVGTKAYVTEYFTGTLAVIETNPEVRPGAESIPLGPEQPMTIARKGERFFHDARLCFQGWLSCSTCHPDARTDGLNWDLLNDGMGNPKSAKSMLLAHQTPPAMITGVRAKAEVAVRSGIRFIQFAVRPEEDAVAIDAYLKSLTPVPSPYLVDGKLSAAAQRGKKLFESAGCAGCHPPPLFTDKQKYDIGTGPDNRGFKEFDTPTLVEIWRTASYLLDGRAPTIMDVLKKYNPKDKHGKTSNLSDQQLADLAEYVLSQ